MVSVEINRDHSIVFEIASKYCILDSFVDHDGYSISSIFYYSIINNLSFSAGSDGKASAAVQEAWVRFVGWEDPLEKEMTTHSSTLAWEIPWMGEPGRLQSMGSQRVRHD